MDCVVANILMTRYNEIRLVFNKLSTKNKDLIVHASEENEIAAIELYTKDTDRSLEEMFIPRLVESHDLYINANSC